MTENNNINNNNKNQQGWISLHRKIENHWLYPKNEKRKFTRYEAWLDLLFIAGYKDSQQLWQGELIKIPRGCLLSTHVGFSARWGWSRATVKKFLDILEAEKMIKTRKLNPKARKSLTLLKINNYEVFQGGFEIDTTLKTTSGVAKKVSLQVSPNNKANKKNNINNDYLNSLQEVV